MATRPDDHSLVRAAQEGDRRALDQLLRMHYDRVHAVCRRITGHDSDAADAAQEAMILIVRNLARFDGRSSFATWAYRIATNASLDELRRRKRRAEPSDHIGDGPVAPVAPSGIEQVAERMALNVALAALPDDYRIPVVLRDVGDLDYAEIADVLDLPLGTVKSRIARGRVALATALAGNRAGSDERPSGEA